MKIPLLILAVALLSAATQADEVFLKSGGQLSGRIVSRTADKVEIDVGAGRVTVPAASVVRIEEGRSALQDYEERACRIAPGDADGWVALGEWASSQGLGTQAREAYNRALTASPNDPRANAALGNVQVDGRWVTEDEGYRARGYVKFEGEWMTPAEHEAILRERASAAEQERQRREADQRARDAEAKGGGGRGAGAAGRRGRGPGATDGPPALVRVGRGPRLLADGADRLAADPQPARRSAPPGAAVSAVKLRSTLALIAVLAAAGRPRPDRGRDRGPARGRARWPGGAAGGAHAAHDRACLRRTGPRGDRAARDRAPRPDPHRVRLPGNDRRLRLGRLHRLARVPPRRRLRPGAAFGGRGRPLRRAGRPRGTARGLEGKGPPGRARRQRVASRGRRARAEGHAQVRRRAARLGGCRDRPRSCRRARRGRRRGTSWSSRPSTATTARRPASASRARSRSASGAGRSGCGSTSRAWR